MHLFGIPPFIWETVGSPERALMVNCGLGPAARQLFTIFRSHCATLIYQDRSLKAINRLNRISVQRPDHALMAAQDDLPLAPGSLDLIVSFWSAHHSPDLKRFLDEIHRLLKNGGHFLLIDGIDHPGTPEQELHRKLHQLAISIDQIKNRPHSALLPPQNVSNAVEKSGFIVNHQTLVEDTEFVLPEEERVQLQTEALRLFNSVYPEELKFLPDGLARFAEELISLRKNISNDTLWLHPFITILASKSKGNCTTMPSQPKNNQAERKTITTGYKLRFRDLPDELKPRQKMIMSGPEALKNHELLAILLISGTTKENVIELAQRLIREYGSRAIAQEHSVRRLMDTLGIGPQKACQIVAAFELGRRFFDEPHSKSPMVLGADDAYEYLKEMASLKREHFRGLYLNTRGRLIRDELISIGTLNMSVVHPREVFRPAVEFSAAAIILAHNHPSGDPTPSEEDLSITRQIVEAGKIMGIEIFDHIIIGEAGYVSLHREGKLK
ncbi:DNA repair protein RadC [bacterium]|nr:DNA repair protein RadC [bacterium]